jgi:hypothetical protein
MQSDMQRVSISCRMPNKGTGVTFRLPHSASNEALSGCMADQEACTIHWHPEGLLLVLLQQPQAGVATFSAS